MIPNMTVTRRYKWKLHPTREQSEALHQQRVMLGELQNACLQRCIDHNSRRPKTRFWNPETREWERWPHIDEKTQRCLSHFDLTNEMTGLRKEHPETRSVTSVTLHRIAQRVVLAFEAFAKRRGQGQGYPRFHPSADNNSIPLGTGTRKGVWKTGWRFEPGEKLLNNWRFHVGPLTDIKQRASWIHARGSLRDLEVDVVDWNNADIIWRDHTWWLSACVTLPSRRAPGIIPTVVRIQAIDYLADVNGVPQTPPSLLEAVDAQLVVDKLQSDFDLAWPMPPDKRKWKELMRERRALPEYNEQKWRIASEKARIARVRANALHVWTANIVAHASSLRIIMPPAIKEATASPRGDEKLWGAAVKDVSALNRHILNFAPSLVVQMLEYKAREAGIEFETVKDELPAVAIGAGIVETGRAIRRAKRQVKKELERV